MLELLNKAPNYSDFFYTEETKKFFNTQFFGSCMISLLNKHNYYDENCQMIVNSIVKEFAFYFVKTLGTNYVEVAQAME